MAENLEPEKYRQVVYHTQEFDGQLSLGHWDHRPVLDLFRKIPVEGKMVADIGCCDGLMSRVFAEGGAERVDAIDRRPMSRNMNRVVSLHPGKIKYTQDDLFKLGEKFPKGHWDVVFSGDLVQHVDDPLGAVKRLAQLASESLYIVTDCRAGEGNHCQVHQPDNAYPFAWGTEFFTRLLAATGMRVRLVKRFQLSGWKFGTRQVGMWEGKW